MTIDSVEKNRCVGCKACVAICPFNAIYFERDDEGFEYPHINKSKCVNCGVCLNVCPAMKNKGTESKQIAYAGRCKDRELLHCSSSGGIFGALAEWYLENNGVIYGVIFDEQFNVKYIRGDNRETVNKMRGSKYVDAFFDEKLLDALINDVNNGKNILFSGTPCQISGVADFIAYKGISHENICYVDFTGCAGKVSVFLWECEKKLCEKMGKLNRLSFRDKSSGWETYKMAFEVNGRLYKRNFYLTAWSKLFGSNLCRRRSCLNCGYIGRDGYNKADISIGDYWFDKGQLPKEWNDNEGISYVVAHTEKGLSKIDRIAEYADFVEIDYHKTGKRNVELNEDERSRFWSVYHNEGYKAVCNMYAKITLKDRLLLGCIRPIMIKLNVLDRLKRILD